jgi:hypothetical protein
MLYPDGITDVLWSTGNNAYTFTVNTAAAPPQVAAVAPVNGVASFLQSGSGRTQFVANDPVTVIEMGIRLPYCFSLSRTAGLPVAVLAWLDALTGTRDYWNKLGFNGQFSIPYPDSGIIDTYIAWEQNALIVDGSPLRVQCLFSDLPTISMVGVPDSLNAAEFEINFWIKLKHTQAMVA